MPNYPDVHIIFERKSKRHKKIITWQFCSRVAFMLHMVAVTDVYEPTRKDLVMSRILVYMKCKCLKTDIRTG